MRRLPDLSERDDEDTLTGIETAHQKRADSVREFAAATLEGAASAEATEEDLRRAYGAVLANWRLEIQTHTREKVEAECRREMRGLRDQVAALQAENGRLRKRLGELCGR